MDSAMMFMILGEIIMLALLAILLWAMYMDSKGKLETAAIRVAKRICSFLISGYCQLPNGQWTKNRTARKCGFKIEKIKGVNVAKFKAN